MVHRSNVRVTGPLAPYAAGFRAHLESQGYTLLSATSQLRVLAHLSRWLNDQRLGTRDLSSRQLERFLRARRRAGYTSWRTMRGLRPLVEYLDQCKVLPTPPSSVPTPLDRLLDRYGSYLIQERGVTPASVRRHRNTARRFLGACVDAEPLGLASLEARDVTEFVLRSHRGYSIASMKILVSELRSFLRFLYLEGHTPTPLAAAAPPVAGWRLSTLPQGLEPPEIRRLLCVSDRRTAVGRRDYAVLMLLVRMGLRAGEAAGLELDDIDWRQGEVVVRGKGRHDERLPLPDDVGEAIVTYLRHGRPGTGLRAVFMLSRAPYTGITPQAVRDVVRHACTKAGISPSGSHRLRHTAATQMLRHGATLPQIAQVLRHRSLTTTVIYAKVDRTSLGELAQPWPGRIR